MTTEVKKKNLIFLKGYTGCCERQKVEAGRSDGAAAIETNLKISISEGSKNQGTISRNKFVAFYKESDVKFEGKE